MWEVGKDNITTGGEEVPFGKATFQAVRSKRISEKRDTRRDFFLWFPIYSRDHKASYRRWGNLEKIRNRYYRHFWRLRADLGTRSDRYKKWLDGADAGEERARGWILPGNSKADRKQSYWSMPSSHFVARMNEWVNECVNQLVQAFHFKRGK